MGGQSFKCPACHKWFLFKGALKQHINDKHHIHNFFVDGVGPATRIVPQLKAEPFTTDTLPTSGSPQGKQ